MHSFKLVPIVLLMSMLTSYMSWSPVAHAEDEPIFVAQDDEDDDEDDDFDFLDDDEDDEDEEDSEERLEEDDFDIDMEEDPDDFEFNPDEDFDDDEDDGDLFDDDEDEIEEDLSAEGVDSATVYRNFADKISPLSAEEQLLEWEEYLGRYPNTLFMDRIQERIDNLTDEVYGERIIREGEGGYQDAKDKEIELAQPLLLERLDPRTRIRIGMELGFPEYLSGVVDFELQLLRELSVHAGIQGLYTGPSFNIGGRYAIIKSARLDLVVTGMLDMRVNIYPAYPAFRPQVGAAKRFNIGGGLEAHVIAGLDWKVGSLRYLGGAHIAYRISETVGVFLETSVNMKEGVDNGPFSFNVATFGLRFYPKNQPMGITTASNIPWRTHYWGYHLGAIQLDGNYYLDIPPVLRK